MPSSYQLPAVESALSDILSAFGLESEDGFRLHPDDRLLDLYEAAHPHHGVDELEFEHLAAVLSEKGFSECTVTALTGATVGDMIELYLLHRSSGIS